tara:strand:+ start:3295 stop:3975 length:681 start_codon:yes stop_codon:yes gene_type:complete
MAYKGILLDLDNTLYNYEDAHAVALEKAVNVFHGISKIDKTIILHAYKSAREKVHIDLAETASSHNRLLYFQKMCEILNVNPLKDALHLYNTYWDCFLENMHLFDGVEQFLKNYKGKVCIITDLTAQIQYRKIKKLNLEKYINYIVTSEEAGKEKPHQYIFMLCLDKMHLNKNDVCMVGDSFNKDIKGALSLGMNAYWINSNKEDMHCDIKHVTELGSFKELLEIL